ncbi:unnamed protein product [Natator depressus]
MYTKNKVQETDVETDPERLSDFLRITQPVGGRARIRIQESFDPSFVLNLSDCSGYLHMVIIHLFLKLSIFTNEKGLKSVTSFLVNLVTDWEIRCTIFSSFFVCFFDI